MTRLCFLPRNKVGFTLENLLIQFTILTLKEERAYDYLNRITKGISFIHSLKYLLVLTMYQALFQRLEKNPCLHEICISMKIQWDTADGEKLSKGEHCRMPKRGKILKFYIRLSGKASLKRLHLRKPEGGDRLCPRDTWESENSDRRPSQGHGSGQEGAWRPEELRVWAEWGTFEGADRAYIRESEMRSDCIEPCKDFGFCCHGDRMPLKEFKQKKKGDKMLLYFNWITQMTRITQITISE